MASIARSALRSHFSRISERRALVIMGLIILFSLQLQNSSGTPHQDYYFGFFNTTSMTSPEKISILVITPESQPVYYSIEAPGEEYYTNGTITGSEQISVNLPTALTTSSHDDRDKGIHLMVSTRVTVIGQSFFSGSTDTFLGLAAANVCVNKCVYYGISVSRNTLFNKTHNSSVLVVGTEDNTMMKLTVTQPVTISVGNSPVDLTAGIQYSFVINRLQTLLIESVDDLTGTKTITDKPVSVLSGHQCGNVPVNVDYCDHLIEQVPPTTFWGRVYYTAPLATRRSYTIKVLAAYSSTAVDIYCNNTRKSYSISEGGSFTYTVSTREYCAVHSNKKVLIAQFSHGQDDDNVTGDPMMTLVPATNQYCNKFQSSTLQGQPGYTHYINIIVLAQCYQPDMIYLTSGRVKRSLDSQQWIPIMVNDVIEAYSVHIKISEGVIEVFHTNTNPCLAAILYGFDDYHGYGHPGGLYMFTNLAVSDPPGSLFVDEINSTAIIVSWSEPDITNGIITSYEILYSVGNILDTDAISIPVDVTTNTSYHVIIGGLDPFTMYSVAVRAYTRIGGGELTDTFSILTVGAETPIYLTVLSVDETTVTLNWNHPELNLPILHYQIHYAHNQNQVLSINSTGTSANLTNLLSGVKYSIYITAFIIKGLRVTSETVTTTTFHAALFQLRLYPIKSCVGWTEDNQIKKLHDIKLAVMGKLKQECSCKLSIVNAAFSCRQSKGDFKGTVVYRAKILSNISAENTINEIDYWVKSETSLTVNQVTLHIDPSCPSMLESFESRDCVVINQSSSSDDPPFGTIVSAAIGGVIGIIVIVAVLLIIMRCYMKKTNQTTDNVPDGLTIAQTGGNSFHESQHIVKD
ncbi:uncharacterized protein [Dysidea avara]|uniref:uncharacterized protein isoform X3 n=1 Tax=Dysidea avara TaxID=196820 RepID=UPI00331A906C